MMRLVIIMIFLISVLFGSGCKDAEIEGGFTAVDVKIPEVVKSVDLLKKDLAVKHPDVKVLRAVSAESQIVAGQKLVIKCEYLSDTNDKPKILRAYIFITLESKYTVEKVEF